MRLDEAALDEYTDQFSWSAWRYETREFYDVPSDDDGFRRYLDGDDPDPEFGVGWWRWLKARARENRQVYRIRVLFQPPSHYLRFEMEWAYTGNVLAGEQIRVLDLTEHERPRALVDDEFWMLDGDRAAVMSYDRSGQFSHADTAEGDDAVRYVLAARAAFDAGEPFEQWWGRHTEYHRASWLGAGQLGE